MAVAFNYSNWQARYPEIIGVSPDLAAQYFIEAQLYCDNTATSPITDEAIRAVFLNMLVAHLARLTLMSSAGIVGRVSSATEGSVSVGIEYLQPGTGAWFSQTVYGAAFWEATKQYRGFQYVAPVVRNFEPRGRQW